MDLEKLFSVRGKTALITGGTSGIGYMIVDGLLQAGAKVFTFGRSQDAVDETRGTLGGKGDLHVFTGDISTHAGVEAIYAEVARNTSKLDILVNNVGATFRAPIKDYPREEFDRVLNVNISSTFDLTRALLPLLRAAAELENPARVINVSTAGTKKLTKNLNNFAYTVSKAGLNMMGQHLASELLPEHINVNTILPGVFKSKLSAFIFDPTHPDYERRPSLPVHRPGGTEDIAGTVIFLSSQAGNYIAGAEIAVSGGVATADW